MPKFPVITKVQGIIIEQTFKDIIAFSPDTTLDMMFVKNAVYDVICKHYDCSRPAIDSLSDFFGRGKNGKERLVILEGLVRSEKIKRAERASKMERAGLLQSSALEKARTSSGGQNTHSSPKIWIIIIVVVAVLVFFLTRKK